MFEFDIIFIKHRKPSFLTKSLHQNRGWQFEEVSWTDLFEGHALLMSKDIGSLSVTSFSSSWSLEMRKHDAMP